MRARRLQKAVYFVVMAMSLAAVIDQIRRPKADRDWHGALFGVPYDFRAPGFRAGDVLWKSEDQRVFTPRSVGVGWDLNLRGLVRLALPSGRNQHLKTTQGLEMKELGQEDSAPAAIQQRSQP